MGERRIASWRHPDHASAKRCHGKAEASEDVVKQQIVLLAIAAATLPNQLLLDRIDVDLDPRPEKRIDRLKRDHRRMPSMQRLEYVQRGFRRTAIADAREVGSDVEAHPRLLRNTD